MFQAIQLAVMLFLPEIVYPEGLQRFAVGASAWDRTALDMGSSLMFW